MQTNGFIKKTSTVIVISYDDMKYVNEFKFIDLPKMTMNDYLCMFKTHIKKDITAMIKNGFDDYNKFNHSQTKGKLLFI